MVVQLLLDDTNPLALDQLPERLQLALTQELATLRRVDRDTVAAVADEFANELEAVGLTPLGSHDGAVTALADYLSPSLASQLRSQMESVRNGDHWPMVAGLSTTQLVTIMEAESVTVCAVALSKLPVAKAAEVLSQTPGTRARRITYAMSQTAGVAPETVRRIGAALAQEYGYPPAVAFERAPVQRLGAILNSATTNTRDDVLDGLGATDPSFAEDVRKAIFTFKDIAERVKSSDIPNCIRSVDGEVLTKAVGAAMGMDAAHVASAEYVLSSVSQRMATQLREDIEERGRIKKADGEAAMSEITKAIREMVEAGMITLIEPDDEADNAEGTGS